MRSWFRIFSVRDARGVIVGVLVLFLVGTLLVTRTDPEARLFRFLRRLPPSVLAVIIESDQPSLIEMSAKRILGVPPIEVPSHIRARATLLVDRGEGVRESVALLHPSQAAAAGIHGPSLAGFTALGHTGSIDALRSSSGNASFPSPDVLRVLRDSSTDALRFLLRPSIVGERIPPLFSNLVPSQPFAVTVREDGGRMTIHGLVPGAYEGLDALANVLLRRELSSALLVLDGLPASELLPPDLPPILAALKEESGIGEELDALSRALGANPAVVALLARDAETADVVVGISLHGVPAEALNIVRKLLERRNEQMRAIVERIRTDGRVIRHRRRAGANNRDRENEAVKLQETSRDGWTILRVPSGAGSSDLVGVWNTRFLLLGTSEESALAVAAALGDVPSSTDLRFRADGQRLRELPVVQRALLGLSESARPWIVSLRSLAGDLDFRPDSLSFDISASFEPAVPGSR